MVNNDHQDPSQQPSAASAPWWTTAFAGDYLERYAHRDDATAAAEIAGILSRLRQAPGPILDACCGNGRHLQVMREQALPAFGFDWSLPLLEVARQRPGLAGRVARSDVRAPAFTAGWGAITLLFTAFGYFSDEENAATLQGLAELLAIGGWLLVDLPNQQQVRQHLVPESQRRLSDGTLITERRWLEGEQVCKRSTWFNGTALQVVDERVRLYEISELHHLATAAGLTWIEVWPSLQGPEIDQQRHVLWLRRL